MELTTDPKKKAVELYKALKANNVELPDEESFYRTLQDGEKASQLYDQLSANGIEVGTEKDKFIETFAPQKKKLQKNYQIPLRAYQRILKLLSQRFSAIMNLVKIMNEFAQI